MAALVAHQKQFVLGPEPVGVRPDWISVRMAEELVLSHCPKLRAKRLRSRDGLEYWLLGLAVPADEPSRSIPEIFRSKDSTEIESWAGFWAGRWLLISRDRCWQDASGALGLNYRRADGNVWISSSPRLLGDHLPDTPSSALIPWRITHRKGIDWIPAPFTTREDVFKLLPQRAINPRDGSVGSARFTGSGGETDGAPEALASALKTILANWGRYDFQERLIGLTAGLDTRTVLAAACAAEIDVQAFTVNYSFMNARDRIVPPRLAASVGVVHTIREPPPVDPDEVRARIAAVSDHMDGAAFHPAFDHLARHESRTTKDGVRTSASGNCFEVGRCHYWNKFARVGLGETPPDPDQVLEAFTFHSTWRPEPLPVWKQAIQMWLESLANPVPVASDWRDRFYLDQRLGSWNCNVQRGGDFLDSTGFSPANCLWIFHLLLRPDPIRRREGHAQREAIRLLAPRLLEIPINPKPMSTRLKQTVNDFLGPRAIHRLKSAVGLMKLHH